MSNNIYARFSVATSNVIQAINFVEKSLTALTTWMLGDEDTHILLRRTMFMPFGAATSKLMKTIGDIEFHGK